MFCNLNACQQTDAHIVISSTFLTFSHQLEVIPVEEQAYVHQKDGHRGREFSGVRLRQDASAS